MTCYLFLGVNNFRLRSTRATLVRKMHSSPNDPELTPALADINTSTEYVEFFENEYNTIPNTYLGGAYQVGFAGISLCKPKLTDPSSHSKLRVRFRTRTRPPVSLTSHSLMPGPDLLFDILSTRQLHDQLYEVRSWALENQIDRALTGLLTTKGMASNIRPASLKDMGMASTSSFISLDLYLLRVRGS